MAQEASFKEKGPSPSTWPGSRDHRMMAGDSSSWHLGQERGQWVQGAHVHAHVHTREDQESGVSPGACWYKV